MRKNITKINRKQENKSLHWYKCFEKRNKYLKYLHLVLLGIIITNIFVLTTVTLLISFTRICFQLPVCVMLCSTVPIVVGTIARLDH